ncbi:MAG TPA: GvpL/GvpF family gas vesicle protein [Bryobacteraceae bacterium]|nr:GvpL/GvpF family gas vesicle protein [Bryobacteraceae bacterium]
MSDQGRAMVLKSSEPEQTRATAPGKRYLFAIVLAGELRNCNFPGIDGKPVESITEGRLTAVVSGIPGEKVRPERRHLAAHQAVLKQLLADMTPLPMSFGILADHPDAVRKILRRNQRMFLEQLEHVAGKVEMGLRVTWDVPNIFEYFVQTNSELRSARDRLLGGNRHPTQEAKIELGRMFDRLLNQDRESHTEQVEQILSSACFETKASPCRNEHEVMNLACLVSRRAQESFGNAVFQAAQLFDNNFAFDYNGPWAPHNFVQVALAP